MKQSEIKKLSTAELQEKLGDTKKSYTDLKMAHAISPCLLYTSPSPRD